MLEWIKRLSLTFFAVSRSLQPLSQFLHVS